MSDQKEIIDSYILKAFLWTIQSARAVQDAGGSIEGVLLELPRDVVVSLVRNNLSLTYDKTCAIFNLTTIQE